MDKKSKFALFGMGNGAIAAAIAITWPEIAVHVAILSGPVYLVGLTYAHAKGWLGLDAITAVRVVYEDADGVRHEIAGSEVIDFMDRKMRQYQQERDVARVETLRAFCNGWESKEEADATGELTKSEAVTRYVEEIES